MPNGHLLIDPKEIGPAQWNQLTEKNGIAFPYMQYEYISICTRGNWKVLTDEGRNYYIPVPIVKKLAWSYVFNPPFSQRMYVLSTSSKLKSSSLLPPLHFLAKNFEKITLNLDHEWTNLPSGFETQSRRNYYHRYGQPVILNHHHQRNMRKAKVEHYSIDWHGDKGVLMKEYIKCTLSRRGRHKKKLATIAQELVDWLSKQDMLRIAFATDRRGKAAAGIGLIRWKGRLINLLPFTTQDGWDGRAMYFLLVNVLRENPYDVEVFDFEGSEIPGVARFYKGFGPSKESYNSIHYIKHPWLLDVLDAATKWFR
jgi:hypothetical protein